MGVKAAELYIKVKGGHFEHIMETKPIFIVNINFSQSIFSKNYQYHSKNLIDSVHGPLQKCHFQMGHPVLFNNLSTRWIFENIFSKYSEMGQN